MSKGALKLPSHKLPSTQEEMNEIVSVTLGSMSPTVVVIFGMAAVEHEIEEILRQVFKGIKKEDAWEKLVTSEGPLGSFYKKTLTAAGLGLIKSDLTHNIHCLRRIRNIFAHPKRVIDFDHESVSSELRSVILPGQHSRYYKKLKKAKLAKNGRESFLGLCFAIIHQLIDRRIRGYKATAKNRARARQRLYANALFGIGSIRVPGIKYPTGSAIGLLRPDSDNPTPQSGKRTAGN